MAIMRCSMKRKLMIRLMQFKVMKTRIINSTSYPKIISIKSIRALTEMSIFYKDIMKKMTMYYKTIKQAGKTLQTPR
jgi:hypothetical protein